MLCTTHDDLERGQRHLRSLSNRSIDGLLLATDRIFFRELPVIEQKEFPVVLCGWETEPYPDLLPVVTIDFRNAGFLAGSHLLALGHRNIAVIYEKPTHELRLQGFCSALMTQGVILSPDCIAIGDSSFKSGYEVTQRLLAYPSRPSAIFASNDLMALGAIEAVFDAGLRCPDDISVIGLDDIPQGSYARPPLTTVALPNRKMAKEMTELLLRCIEQAEQKTHFLTLLRPHLVIRHSTAAPYIHP